MFLSSAQSKQFYRLLYKLCEYAERTRNITGVPQSMNAASNPEDQRDILDMIAEDTSIIDEMLAQEPQGLSENDIATYGLWKHMYGDIYILKGYTENGNALFLTPFGPVEVQGVTQDIRDLIPETPAIVSTILLPFDGIITYSSNISEFPVSVKPDFFEQMEDWDTESQSIIRDATSFVIQRDQYVAEQAKKDFEEFEHELAREYARYKGTLEPSDGFHKGALADLSDEERERTLREMLYAEDPELKESMKALFDEVAIKAHPDSTLECCLGYYKKDILINIARELGITSTSSKNKSLLSSEIAIRLLDTWWLNRMLEDCSSSEINSLKELLEAGGIATLNLNDTETFSRSGCMPFTFMSKKTDDEYTVFIPKDLQVALKKQDLEAMAGAAHMTEHIISKIELAADMYGIAPIDDFIKAVLSSLEIPADLIPPDLIYDLIVGLSEEEDASIYVVDHNDETCVLCYELDPDFIIGEDNDAPQEDIRRLEENILTYWGIILEAQREYGLRPLPDTESFYEYVWNLPSAKALKVWLDGHVPDGEDDIHYANCIVDELIDVTRTPASPQATIDVLKDFGAFSGDIDEGDELLAHTMRFMNDVPRWDTAGWSPSEILEKQTGHKIFYGENGKPMKIGRNDLCPCGSGKKYKKCCGR